MPADRRLSRYNAKRRFDETAEPKGVRAADKPGALYIIQKHDARRLHYDFRLELDGVLLSWAVTRGPSYRTADKRLAVRTEDHPLDYGGFEGTIPAGNYGAGTVMLWDKGSWESIGNPKAGLKSGKLAFVLHGERLRGRWALVRMGPRAKANTGRKADARRENWLLIKERDDYANTQPDLLAEQTTSVISGRDLDQIAKAANANNPLPKFCEPALATLVDTVPSGEEWLFEIKFDGYRAQIAASGANVRILTRSGLDWSEHFPQIVDAFAALDLDRALIDSEIVVLDREGRSDFAALIARLETGQGALTCFAFDLLFAAGADLRDKPLGARQAELARLLAKARKNGPILLSETFAGDAGGAGASLLEAACQRGLEGIIAKRRDAPYRSGRHQAWLKIKCGHEQEFVILGFSRSARGRPFASLLVGLNEGGKLRYAGRVGSGFDQRTLETLAAARDRLRVKTPPAPDVPAQLRRDVIWVKPVLVANIAFGGWTHDNYVRHGRYLGLREDKKPQHITREVPKPLEKGKRMDAKIEGTELSHADKLLYRKPDISKIDLARYLETVSPLMLPFIAGRFVTLVRCPAGAAQKCFFQRHPHAGFGEDWLHRTITNQDGKAEDYIYFEKPAALIAAVQMSVLEFHVWGSKVDAVDKPDRVVFDLDPDPAVDFAAVKAAALRVRDVLDALDLQSFPLLSGGKGIHVVVPIQRRHQWPVVKAFAGQVANRLAADAPADFVATMSKAKRKGKIFIDHFRNEEGATAIAPYSPRARAGAPVAWPVTWAGLTGLEAANAMSIGHAMAAVAKGENAWTGYSQRRQSLSAAALRAVGVEE